MIDWDINDWITAKEEYGWGKTNYQVIRISDAYTTVKIKNFDGTYKEQYYNNKSMRLYKKAEICKCGRTK